MKTSVPSLPGAAKAVQPASHPLSFRPLERRDFVALAVVFAASLGVYTATLSPSVTLEDSGELITGAATFGVPHPPGYPLWSLSGFLLVQILPVGSYAWRINFLSALFAAAASGLVAALASSSSRWLLGQLEPLRLDRWRVIGFAAGLTAGFALAFSDVMWSQAVIAEVYTLNALFLVLVIFCLYRWLLDPLRTRWLIGAVLSYTLGLTNHHTLLLLLPAFLLIAVFARAPELQRTWLAGLSFACLVLAGLTHQAVLFGIPIVIAGLWVVRRPFFPSFLAGFSLLALSALGVFTNLSGDPLLSVITWRAAWITIALVAALAFWFTRRRAGRSFLAVSVAAAAFLLLLSQLFGGPLEIKTAYGILMLAALSMTAGLVMISSLDKRLIAGMFAAGWLGLLPYGYMPLASSTHPPMDWGFAREPAGFFHAVNRGQYPNNLAFMIKSLADKVGLIPREPEPGATQPTSASRLNQLKAVGGAILQYGRSLDENFTTPICVVALVLIFYLRYLPPPAQSWIVFLVFSFFLLAFMMTFLEPPGALDNNTIWVTRVFTLQSHCLFVLFIAYGLSLLARYLLDASPDIPLPSCLAMLLLTLLPLRQNVEECSLAGHWFGWQFGHDMLQPLAPNAVLFGGTDPGRFIPTYMIFVESQQPSRYKRDPSFDRRDVFIVTQNALADEFYLRSLRDQYDARVRPKTWTAFERWLGRDTQYPPTSIRIPTPDDYNKAFEEFALASGQAGTGQPVAMRSIEEVFLMNGILSRMIFEQNKAEHTFYIEESLAIPWMYDYLVPDGLLMRFEKEPLKTIPPEIIEKDRAFWDAYTRRLLESPSYARDIPARRSFSKLRLSIGNLYAHHRLDDEAIHAFRQAHSLAPESFETAIRLADFLHRARRFDEAETIVRQSIVLDPLNPAFHDLARRIGEARRVTEMRAALEARLAAEPDNADAALELLSLYLRLDEFEKFDALLRELAARPDIPTGEIMASVEVLYQAGRTAQAYELLHARSRVDPTNVNLQFNLAALAAERGETAVALQGLGKAIEAGGDHAREAARQDARFTSLRTNQAFLRLLNPSSGTPAVPHRQPKPRPGGK